MSMRMWSGSLSLLLVAACTALPTNSGELFSVGGNITGLVGTLSLNINNVETLQISKDGPYSFKTGLRDTTVFSVNVSRQPIAQICTVAQTTGTISGTDISNIDIVCAGSGQRFTVGGTVAGIDPNVELVISNGNDTLSLSTDGPFEFATPVAVGATYDVTVQQNPSGEQCSITNGLGTIDNANVITVAVHCTDLPATAFSLGGTVTGLAGGATVVLQNGSGETVSLTSNTDYTFPTSATVGAAYNVAVATQPNNQTCTVSNGVGNAVNANVDNIDVNCVTTPPNTFQINVVANNLVTGTSVGITYNGTGGNVTTLPLTVASGVSNGTAYDVEITRQPDKPARVPRTAAQWRGPRWWSRSIARR